MLTNRNADILLLLQIEMSVDLSIYPKKDLLIEILCGAAAQISNKNNFRIGSKL